MPGLGLVGAGGAMGGQNALEDMIKQRLQAEAVRQQLAQQQFTNSMQTRQMGLQEANQKSLAQDRQDRLDETTRNNKVGGALRLAPLLKPGQAVTSGDAQNFQEAGMGSLIKQTLPQVASTQYRGTANAPGLRTGPSAPVGAPSQISSPAQAAGQVFTGTQTQDDTAAKEADLQRYRGQQNDIAGVRADAARAQAEAAQARAEAAAAAASAKNAPLDISPDIQTTRSGAKYLDLSQYSPSEREKAHQAANAQGVRVLSKEDSSTLSEIDKVSSNQDDILSQITSKLPKDAAGRVIGGTANKLSQFFQTDDDLAAFMTWRGTAIATLRALAGSKGLRLNQAEINMAIQNDIPQVTDTVGVAQKKISNIKKALGNAENAITQRDRSAPAPTATTGGGPIQKWGRDAQGRPVKLN